MTSARFRCVGDGLVCGSNNFGILRLILALAVVVSHAFSVASGYVDNEPLMHATGFTLGEHAVNGFFAISGFLVTMSYERRGWRDYGLARLLRIVPGLVAATLFVSLVIGAMMTRLDWASYFTDGRLWRFIFGTLTTFKSAAALPDVFDENPLSFPMGTVWTLKYECLCYFGVFCAGLIGLLCRRRLVLCLWALLLAAVILREIIAPGGAKGVETGLRLPLIFVTGGLIYLWRERVPLSVWGLCGLAILVTLLAKTPLYKAALFSVTAWGVIVLALAPALTAWRSTPEADVSYGVYLYGWPVQQVFYALFPAAGALTLLAPSLLLTLLLAWASWHFVEKPALGIKRRLICD